MKHSTFLPLAGCLLVLAFLVPTTSLAKSNDSFAQANQEFAQGKFKEAVDGYEAIVRSGEYSANLFYNLGNAYFRSDNLGQAILNYERALALEPRHPETLANLRIARDKARALELPQGWTERLEQYASATQYTFAACILLWLSVFVLTSRVFAQRPAPLRIILALALLLMAALLSYAIFSMDRGSKGRSLAIVTGTNITARLATADNSTTVLALPPGSEIKIVRQRGDWVYADLPNNLQGWIPAQSAQLVRL